MQAITTTYLPCTNCEGPRIKAQCARGSITIPYPEEANFEVEAHGKAVKALLNKFLRDDIAVFGDASRSSWEGTWVPGGLLGGLPGKKTGPTYAWVCNKDPFGEGITV